MCFDVKLTRQSYSKTVGPDCGNEQSAPVVFSGSLTVGTNGTNKAIGQCSPVSRGPSRLECITNGGVPSGWVLEGQLGLSITV